ncbi:hypothetical protein LINPERHAP2_LOCUS14704 [Linum perenne]
MVYASSPRRAAI